MCNMSAGNNGWKGVEDEMCSRTLHLCVTWNK